MVEQFRPLGDRVLVKRDQEPERTASGIIIPDAAKDKGRKGTVIAVGTGRKDSHGVAMPLDVKVGHTVYFGQYAGTEIDKEYLIIREDEILGVIGK
jgi:chaperonin GroES